MEHCSKCGNPMGYHDKACGFCHPAKKSEMDEIKRKHCKAAVLVSTILVALIGFYPLAVVFLNLDFGFRSTFFNYELFISGVLVATCVMSFVAYARESWGFTFFCGLLGPASAIIISVCCGGLFETSVDGWKNWIHLFATYFLPNIVLMAASARLICLGREGESDYTLHYRRLQKITCNDEQSMV